MRKKWVIVALVSMALGFIAIALMLCVFAVAFLAGHQTAASEGGLPSYETAQINSTHSGYRRTILTGGGETYVNDFEEYGLLLDNLEPTQIIGRIGFANAKVGAIPGQPTTAYVAADMGSEMPAYVVFRNSKQPAFDWRTRLFQQVRFAPRQGGAMRSTRDPEVISAVVQALNSKSPAHPTTPPSSCLTNISSLALSSEQFPGIAFCPAVYFDPAGGIYLSENVSIQPSKDGAFVTARWVPAGLGLSGWLTVQ